MTAIDPHWYKDAVFYQLHVKTFCDSDADGVGDFKGLTSKLDYLSTLGVDCLWLLPTFPSPFRDDGYDIADYYSIHPMYGSLQDFRDFLDAAHACGLKVITELVLNHTSDKHPWFQEARSSADNPRRDWYVWSDTDDRYRDVRIIFLDTEASNWAWDPVSKAYYWHRFFSHQPDLNYDNPAVREEMWNVMKYWLDMGVDGFRVDAVPYLIEREGTSCENLPETHDVLKFLRQRLDQHFTGKALLAEANQWPEDVRPYFGDGDEFHMAFHFPLMPRMFMALRLEDRKPLVEIIERTPPIPETCQWGIFLRNHDELTLEMVTTEERDYMYDEYARDPVRAAEPRYSAEAIAATRGRSAPRGTAERSSHVAAGQSDHLLRRRDRHGRQHLPRRSQRRSDPDAVERWMERRILGGRSRAPRVRPHLQSAVRLSGRQRGRATEKRAFTPQLDEAASPGSKVQPGVQSRLDHAARSGEPPGAGLHPRIWQGAGPRGEQSRGYGAGRRA